MEALPYAVNERVVVSFGPSYVSARIVAVGDRTIDVVCDGRSTVRTVDTLLVFRPGPEVEALIAKISEPGVTQWDLSPLLKALYDRHPHLVGQ